MDVFKIACLVLFILLCIPVYIFGNRNELRIKNKKDILESKDKVGLDKESLLTLTKGDEYPLVFMLAIPAFIIMILLYHIFNKLEVTNFLLITLGIIILVSELIFLIIWLLNNRHYNLVKKDKYEVNTYELKEKRIDKKKLYFVFDDKEYKVDNILFNESKKDEEFLVITINKKYIILPSSKYYFKN